MSNNTNDVKTTPVHVTEVKVNGAEMFEPSFINKIVSPLLSSEIQTLGEVEEEGNKVLSQLSYLNAVASPSLVFSLANGESKTDATGEPVTNIAGEIKAVFNTGSNVAITSVHNEIGNALALQYINRNVFKKGELLQFNAALNLYNDSKSIDLLYSKPLRNTEFKTYGRMNLLSTHEQSFKSNSQDSTSAEFGFIKQYYCRCPGTFSTLTSGLSLARRNINEIADSADDEIKTYAGTNIKRSVFVNFVTSNMKYLSKSKFTLPLHGLSASVNNEASGFFDTSEQDKFVKSTAGLTYAKSLFSNAITLSSDLKIGTILNFAETVNFQDKFYPFVPGYSVPIAPDASIGAGSFVSYNFGIHTKCGLIKTEEPIRFYASVQGVSCADQIDGLKIHQLSSLNQFKSGVDIGLVYTTGDANAKLSYTKAIGDKSDIGKIRFEVELTGEW
ncbi:hypothetical protein CANINC_002311 [Pichia inconspicua]|uniref:Bacterial surface antigen (D15) domain-containing protein n=1 Tax=Pichia inconspicua TaxID=52247 RepID=A0A4T0X1H2_9ASCO|nr:hypothetical protein CANINC_002311 [[Candida] inconspicua]